MKAVLLIDNLNSGGAQRQIVNLAIGLKARNVDVAVMTYNRGEHFQDELKRKDVRLIPLTFNSDINTFFGVIAALRKEKPDVICAYLFVPSLIALVSKFFH
jgi:GalNAc-alpha-(1->4)-GalNAc-alpha-(1->3)-diNAcBac-PP-undecaprenol alpha-1,4-N-acetyl-D-galactosaminyltransferase